ncbi:hypothetical protein Y958_00745 [Nitrospirillum viridazoti CBAmc]|uniref:Helicase/UvrB N-terminal domain-containing protein n=2 Tax=Nitrospirillum TaxID=1543705 RepID=A0A248JLU7_9PROT|nr:hypothetical protein Y958_00745 [Nitrospirillum amazonense CBAmc]
MDALHDLLDIMCMMAEGRTQPSYYLSSLDPGLGKTTAVVSFLKALCASDQHRHVSALVCLARREEIRDVIEGSGLSSDEFAVLAGKASEGPQSARWVDLDGLGGVAPDKARVLFTTQAMVKHRCKRSPFEDVSAFQYRGELRQVRIWDESFEIAEGITMDHDAIAELFRSLRVLNPEATKALLGLHRELEDAPDGTIHELPDLASPFGLQLVDALDHHGSALSPEKLETLYHLVALSSQTCVVRHFQGRRYLIGKATPIPGDLAPVVILDASGRVRQTYTLWERHRRTLVRLKAAAKDYSRLTIHHWFKGGGRETIRDDISRYADAVAAAINTKPDQEWLVVHHKPRDEETDLAEAVLSGLEGNLNRVRFLTWGRHHGTNEYADIPNVVLVGALYQRDIDHEARWHACSEIAPGQQRCSEEDRLAVEEGEFRHMVLQALCRVVVRKNEGGTCAPCTAYVIAKKGDVVRSLKEAFPGAAIVPWHPETVEPSGRVAEALEIIRAWLDAGVPDLLPFKSVARTMGIQPRTFRDNVRQHPLFMSRLAALGVEEAGGGGVRKTGFARIAMEADRAA